MVHLKKIILLVPFYIGIFGTLSAQFYNQSTFDFNNTTVNHQQVVPIEENEKVVMVTKFHGSSVGDPGKAIKVMRLDQNDNVIWSNTFYTQSSIEEVRGFRIKNHEDEELYIVGTVLLDDGRLSGLALQVDAGSGSLINQQHFSIDEFSNYHVYPLDIERREGTDELYITGFISEDDIWVLDNESRKYSFFMELDANRLSPVNMQTHNTPINYNTSLDADAVNRMLEIPGTGFLLIGSQNTENPNAWAVPKVHLVDYSGNTIWNQPFTDQCANDHVTGLDAVYLTDEDEDERIYVMANSSVMHATLLAKYDLSGNYLGGQVIHPSELNWHGFDLEKTSDEIRIGGMFRGSSTNNETPSFLVNLDFGLNVTSSEVYNNIPSEDVLDHGGYFAAFPNAGQQPLLYAPDILGVDGQDNYLNGFHLLPSEEIGLEFFNLGPTGGNDEICHGTNPEFVNQDFDEILYDDPIYIEEVTIRIEDLVVDYANFPHDILECKPEIEGLNKSENTSSLNNEVNKTNTELKAYPSPWDINKNLKVELKGKKISNLNIYQSNGRKLVSYTDLSSNKYYVNPPDKINEGLFLLKVETHDGNIYHKSIIAR